MTFAAQIQHLNLGVNVLETVWNTHAHRKLQTAKDGILCAKIRGSRKWRVGATCVSLVPSLVCSTRCCYPRCQPGSFSWTGRSLWLVHCSEQHPGPHPSKQKASCQLLCFYFWITRTKRHLHTLPCVAKQDFALSIMKRNQLFTRSEPHHHATEYILGPAWLGQTRYTRVRVACLHRLEESSRSILKKGSLRPTFQDRIFTINL